MNSEVNYYAGGNTGKGFVHFFESNFQNLDRLFILKGGPGTGKSTLMKRIGKKWQNEGYAVEWIHCSADVGSVDAVIIPQIRAGIVDGTSPHIIEPALPGIVDDYVNLGLAWDRQKLMPFKEKVQQVNGQLKQTYRQAYQYLQKARDILTGEKEQGTADESDQLAQWAETWVKTWLPERETARKPVIKHRFYGAFTPDGYHHFAGELLAAVEKRFFLAGSYAIPTILEKIGKAGRERGYDMEIYYNALDPDLVEMVVFPELEVALFDHTLFPKKLAEHEHDEWVAPGEGQMALQNRDVLKELIEKATEYLAETSQLRAELESYYIRAMDFSIVNQIGAEIEAEFMRLHKE